MVHFKGLSEAQILAMAGRPYHPAALREAQRWGMVARILVMSATVGYACVLFTIIAGTSNGFALMSVFLLGSAGALPLGWADSAATGLAVRRVLARHTPLPERIED